MVGASGYGAGVPQRETKRLNDEVIYKHMLAFGDFTTPAAMGKRIGFHRVTIRLAFLHGLDLGLYETRDSEKWTNPVTGGPATEYRAVPRGTA
jgi:hypothetical protein